MNACLHAPRAGAAGFSLIEFMIAITVSLIVLVALSATFVANSRARLELDRANQQIENGRYALMALTDDLQVAGYWAHFDIRNGAINMPAVKPALCSTVIAPDLTDAMHVPVQGVDNDSAETPPLCDDGGGTNVLDDWRKGTDVLVVRRVSTCALGDPECPAIAGAPYFQPSLCESELQDGINSYRFDTNPANLDRTLRDCVAAAPIRQFLVHVYFIANNGEPGDGIPTLKRAELGAGYNVFSIANGIESIHYEYGIDTSDPPDGVPETFIADAERYDRAAPGAPLADCAANADCVANLNDIVAVKVSLLARNPAETRGHVDTKVYSLGLNVDGDPQCANDSPPGGGCDAFNDGFKRHVYQAVIRLNNVAGRRE